MKMMEMYERSAFGLGIIASKEGKSLEDCPFNDSEFKRKQWINGFNSCENNEFGDMKKHGLYENIEEE